MSLIFFFFQMKVYVGFMWSKVKNGSLDRFDTACHWLPAYGFSKVFIPVCPCGVSMHACTRVKGCPKRKASDCLELELQAVVSLRVGAGNRNQVLWKSVSQVFTVAL